MSKVKPILYMLGKGGISVLQTAIFYVIALYVYTVPFIMTFDIYLKKEHC